MDKLKDYWVIISLGLAILIGAFYWYEYRPTKIRRECFEASRGGGIAEQYLSSEAEKQTRYLNCLKANGISK